MKNNNSKLLPKTQGFNKKSKIFKNYLKFEILKINLNSSYYGGPYPFDWHRTDLSNLKRKWRNSFS